MYLKPEASATRLGSLADETKLLQSDRIDKQLEIKILADSLLLLLNNTMRCN